MAADTGFLDRVKKALRAKRTPFEGKRMFGGITLMVGGKMCISVGKSRLMFPIDPADHEAALKRQGARTVVMKDRKYIGYAYVDFDAPQHDADLTPWVELALDNNRRLT